MVNVGNYTKHWILSMGCIGFSTSCFDLFTLGGWTGLFGQQSAALPPESWVENPKVFRKPLDSVIQIGKLPLTKTSHLKQTSYTGYLVGFVFCGLWMVAFLVQNCQDDSNLVKLHRDFTRGFWAPKWWPLVREIPLNSGKSSFVKYFNLAR